jgi:hypothetical protein
MKKVEPRLFDGKTIDQYRDWIPVPHGLTAYQPWLRHQVGLFRALQGSRSWL